ncbi:MAG: ribonuclease [Firmicutes bacterium]|nr:ribonuclease [Bacillota bacterium]
MDQAEEYLASQEEGQAEGSPDAESQSEAAPAADSGEAAVSEGGHYSDPVSVALYLHTYGHLPDNYLTKSEAEALGWNNSLGNLWDVAPGCSIGGDKFGNREGLLPKAKGRQYYECDVNFDGGFRGGERIVYSNDGLIFYTADHYSSYTQLY